MLSLQKYAMKEVKWKDAIIQIFINPAAMLISIACLKKMFGTGILQKQFDHTLTIFSG
jgi:hypothetical protein